MVAEISSSGRPSRPATDSSPDAFVGSSIARSSPAENVVPGAPDHDDPDLVVDLAPDRGQRPPHGRRLGVAYGGAVERDGGDGAGHGVLQAGGLEGRRSPCPEP